MPGLDQTIAILGDLIAFPTVSSDSNLDMIAYLADRLDGLGGTILTTHDDSGTKANLFVTFGPESGGGVLLSGHTDVVPAAPEDWASDPFTLARRDGRLYGRGSCDMKGFVAACLALAQQLDMSRLTRPLHVSFTYDEETGCLGAGRLVEVLRERGIAPDIAIIGEPTEMRVIEGHKGCYEYSTAFTGKEGHGSEPDKGVNAVEYAARYATRLLALREDLKPRAPASSRFDPPWTTLNIGRLAGGVAHNVIAGRAEIDWEMRPVQAGDADFVKDAIAEYCATELLPAMRAVDPDAAIATTVIGEVVGLEPMPANAARDLASELTGANAADLVAFGTEAGLFQGLGTDVVVCGPGSIAQAHKPDEFLAIDQLQACCDMLDRLGRRLTGHA